MSGEREGGRESAGGREGGIDRKRQGVCESERKTDMKREKLFFPNGKRAVCMGVRPNSGANPFWAFHITHTEL